MKVFEIDYSEIEKLEKAINNFGVGSEQAIVEVMKKDVLLHASQNIKKYINASGRSWNGKVPGATTVQPFTSETKGMDTIVKTRKQYNYLYFADDGSDTVNHAGLQDFMMKGGNDTIPEIIDICLEKLEYK